VLRPDWTRDSDIDALVLIESGPPSGLWGTSDGIDLDVFVESVDKLLNDNPRDWHHLADAHVVFDPSVLSDN
jgi:predicted nucleotidyltransferase